MNNPINFTRVQYRNNECTHREYYGQFVTPAIKKSVIDYIGKADILKVLPHDYNLNTIPLLSWDNATIGIRNTPTDLNKQFYAAGDSISLGGLVCLAKEAARQVYEDEIGKIKFQD